MRLSCDHGSILGGVYSCVACLSRSNIDHIPLSRPTLDPVGSVKERQSIETTKKSHITRNNAQAIRQSHSWTPTPAGISVPRVFHASASRSAHSPVPPHFHSSSSPQNSSSFFKRRTTSGQLYLCLFHVRVYSMSVGRVLFIQTLQTLQVACRTAVVLRFLLSRGLLF